MAAICHDHGVRMDRKTLMAVVTSVVAATAAWFLAGSNDEATESFYTENHYDSFGAVVP